MKSIFLSQGEIRDILDGNTRTVYRVAGIKNLRLAHQEGGTVSWSLSLKDKGKVKGESRYSYPQNVLDEIAMCYCNIGILGERLWVRESFRVEGCLVRYKASHPEDGSKWKSPLYMSKSFSRMSLHVERVSLRRLSEVLPEGERFKKEWDGKNKLYPASSDPWVWAISFKVTYP